jgi:hypothetical protein
VPDYGEPYDNPERIIPGGVTEEYKEFLLFVQSLRKKDVIDPDYMIATGLKGIDKFRAGDVVVMEGHWGAMAADNVELKKIVPEGDISYMKQLQGPKQPMGALTLTGFDRGFSVSIRAQDKLDGIFRFLDWVYTDGYEYVRYGKEGKTFNWVDGVRVMIPTEERESGWQGPNMEPFGFPPKVEDVWPKWDEQLTFLEERGLADKLPHMMEMFITSAENAMPNWNHLTFSPTAGEKSSMLFEQYTRPMQERFAIDPDLAASAFDDAIAGWLAEGGQQIIDEVNEIQTVKSPIKPTYTLPDGYKDLLG